MLSSQYFIISLKKKSESDYKFSTVNQTVSLFPKNVTSFKITTYIYSFMLLNIYVNLK